MRKYSFLFIVFFVATAVRAQQISQVAPAWSNEASVSVGYSNIQFPDHNLHYATSGPYIDTDIAFAVPDMPNLRVGGGLSFSGFYGTSFAPGIGDVNSTVNMVSLEARAAWPIPGDVRQGFFFTPRIGIGMLFNNYYIESPINNVNFNTNTHNGFGLDIRPNIQLGYRWRTLSAGVEASYMAGWGDFGQLGSLTEEARVGLFLSMRL